MKFHALLPIILFSFACSGNSVTTDGGVDDSGSSAAVSLPFEVTIGEEAWSCGQSYVGLGTDEAEFHFRDLRFYVHDFEAKAANGSWTPLELIQDELWQYDNIGLLDFEGKSTGCDTNTEAENHSIQLKSLPSDTTAIRFKLGVPKRRNHAIENTSPSPLNLTTMYWSWLSGYKFMRLEGEIDGVPGGWIFHLGSAQCKDLGNGEYDCSDSNVANIELDFEPGQSIILDLKSLLSKTTLKTDGGGHVACMSSNDDPECGTLFDTLGLAHPLNTDPKQIAFSAR